MKVIKHKIKGLGFLMAITVFAISFLALAPNAIAVPVTVDFDALDTSEGWVSGEILDSYLAGYGVTLSNITPGSTVGVGNQSMDMNAIPSSSPNWLGQYYLSLINGMSYRLNFSNPLDSLSFTRVGIPGLTSGVIAPEWSVTAYNASDNFLDSFGEPLRSVWPWDPVPAQQFTFDKPDISYIIVYSNVYSRAGMGSMPIDDLIFDYTPIPEPATMLLLGSGLIGLAGVRRKFKK